VNKQYFQQAVLLRLLKALYYAGICSYVCCMYRIMLKIMLA